MCLALPVQVIQRIDGDRAKVNLGGVIKEISIAFVPEVLEGDYVILHSGFALTRLNEQEAQKTLALFDEMMQGAE